MNFKSILFFVLILVNVSMFSQDVLYTTGANLISAKVLEINSKDIKYKDFNNIEGPTYVISKTDVVLIKYSNGVTEVINDNPPTLAPKAAESSATTSKLPVKANLVEKKPLNLYYLNNNMLSINALALANGDVTLMYDRDLFNSKMSISFLGGYNFNAHMGGLNMFIADSKDKAKKKYDAGFGINFMPRNTKRVQYFVGLLGKYMSYDYDEVVSISNNQKIYQRSNGYQFAIMISNGWIFRVSPNFNFKVFGAFGAPINSTELRPEYRGVPKVYLGYCFGYRF